MRRSTDQPYRGPRMHIPAPGKDARCEDCGLTYDVRDSDGEPITQYAYTCDDCGGAVEAVKADPAPDNADQNRG